MLNRLLAYVLTAAIALPFTAPAAYGSQESAQAQTEAVQMEATQTEAAQTEMVQTEAAQTEAAQTEAVQTAGKDVTSSQVWNTDIRLALQRENTLRKEAGLSLKEWDEAVLEKKEEGKAAPLTKEAVLAADPDAQILEEDSAVYFIDKADALGDVRDALDAYRAAYSASPLMGGNALADLRLWHQLEINDVRIYSFQQISDSTMVMGSTLKLAVRDGKVCAVFSSLDPESGKEENLVTQEQAEDVVREKLAQEGKAAEILPDDTERIRYNPSVMADLNLDNMDDDPVPEEVRWVVYSENTDEEYPYTAHYVDLAGNYLECLAVEAPGSDEALCGFRKQKIFEGMEADTWTGEIKGEEDSVRTVTLPVMRDAEGRLYLGDVKRKIAVADFARAVYDDSHPLELIQSDDNAVFDNEDLYMYYNYLNAWNFYADMGWIGPDGEGTEVVILKGLCTSDGTPYENACSIGMIQGWQMFGYASYSLTGEPLGLGRGLDVMAHEYTHTFTSTVMNSNLYENDQGAINEAMSDIFGNLAEFILQETDDSRWLLGEQTGEAIRSMSDPASCQQPVYVWDEFYGQHTDIPNEANDRGGVHMNSSLLNHIAASLCLEDGMQYEDAVRFWIMTAGGLTPKTDYPQICAVMKWAVNESGNEAFSDSLNEVIEEKRLDREEIPEMLPADRKIVRLTLPDTETFASEYWTLLAFQLNTETIRNAASTLVQLAAQLVKDGDDAEAFGRILSEFLNSIHLDGSQIKLEKSGDTDDVADAVADAMVSSVSRIVEQSSAWRRNVGEDIIFVTDDDPTFYLLLSFGGPGLKIDGAAALIGKRWVNLSPFLMFGDEITALAAGKAETEAEQESILDLISSLTPDQWESLFDITMAVGEVIHPDQSEADEKQSASSGREHLTEDLLDLAVSALQLAAAGKEEQGEVLFPARTQQLPAEGLEKVTLVQR